MEEFALKFLLGSNLKEQLGETEVTREAEMSGEKFGVTAELPGLPGSGTGFVGKGFGGKDFVVGRDWRRHSAP